MPAFHRADSGQVLPLAAVLIALAAGIALLVGHLGLRATQQARAQTAADAAALAAVLDGSDAAAVLALANGASLESADVVGGRATVRVVIAGQAASASAELLARPDEHGLAPTLVAAIREAERLLGGPLPIVSGYRSTADQQALWDGRQANPYPVASPGTSAHELGLAIDVARSSVVRLQSVASLVGLCQPLPAADPVHFELCRTTATR